MVSQIKSKERVKELAEVYTNEREVNAMLDLTKEISYQIGTKYLEPACGNGNFLIKILERKLETVKLKYSESSLKDFEFYILRSLSTMYGIDICPENVEETKQRLYTYIKSFYDLNKGSSIYSLGFFESIHYILNKNILRGDTINEPEFIIFTEFKVKKPYFIETLYPLVSMYEKKSKPSSIPIKTHFLKLGEKEYERE